MSIEVTSRELEARTLLASYAVKHGFEVVMGRKKELIEQALVSEPGIFLSQWGLHRNFKKLYRTLKSLGHTIVCLDEEGLVTFRRFEDYVATKVDSECLSLVDKVLCWGTSQENNFKTLFPEYSFKFEAVGNPRDDILADVFNDLFAFEGIETNVFKTDPIIFVSSFGFANHVEGAEKYFQKSVRNGVFFNKKVEEIYSNYLSFQKANFTSFVSLVKIVAEKFPGENIIYRFHPGEDRKILVDEFSGYKNVTFSFGGALIPLLKRSKLVVHHLCHAGIEAQILGKITIAFRAERDAEIEDERVYSRSISLSRSDEVISFIDNLASSRTNDCQGKNDIESKDFIFRSTDELASERIVKTFQALSENEMGGSKKRFLIAKNRLKSLLKRLRASQDGYTDQKSEGLTDDAIRSMLDTISQVAPRADRDIDLTEIASYVFLLNAENN